MILPALPAFWCEKAVLQVQAVLYNADFDDVRRTVEALARAVELAVADGILSRVVLRFGDSSSIPSLDADAVALLREAARETMVVKYDYFAANLGSARGHNRLAAQAEDGTQFIWIQNPDVVVSPRLFETVMEPFRRSGVGQVEAKQLPVEHPKDYDASTGETDWTTTACVMMPLTLFRELDGFDAESFFMYCDDVDLSFRARELGYRLIFQPAAICFHDKRLSVDGAWQPSKAEQYYSAEAGLLMAHKWSYPELLRETLEHFDTSANPDLQRANKIFRERQQAGTLTPPRDPDHKVAKFKDNFYSKNRYPL